MDLHSLPFDQIVEQLNDGVLVVSLPGEIIYVNLQMSAILGYAPEEMYGRQLFDFMSPEWAARAKENLKRRAMGVEERFDHQFLHKNGESVWTMVSTRPVELEDGTRISLVAIRDITQRMEMEEALRALTEELEQRVRERTEALEHEVETRREAERLALQASEAKSRLLANMSHELRTPLNAIIGYSEMLIEDEVLLRDETQEDFSAEEDLGKILSSAKHLLRLVDEVLDLSKIEAGHMSLDLETFSPGELMKEIATITQPLVVAQQNTLVIEDSAQQEVHLDRLKLKQILLNLISNAARFTTGGTITVRSSKATYKGKEAICIAVEDDGEGIAGEDLTYLFQPFIQSSSASYAKKTGTGLGLAICERYSKMMKGKITVTSAVGEGSCFTLYLPTRLTAPDHSLHAHHTGDHD